MWAFKSLYVLAQTEQVRPFWVISRRNKSEIFCLSESAIAQFDAKHINKSITIFYNNIVGALILQKFLGEEQCGCFDILEGLEISHIKGDQ